MQRWDDLLLHHLATTGDAPCFRTAVAHVCWLTLDHPQTAPGRRLRAAHNHRCNNEHAHISCVRLTYSCQHAQRTVYWPCVTKRSEPVYWRGRMPSPLKRPGRAAIVFVLVGALAGCMRVDRSLQVNGDGSGSYILTVSFRQPEPGVPASVSQSVVAPMEDFGAHVRQTGGSYRRTVDQGYASWTYIRPLRTVLPVNP